MKKKFFFLSISFVFLFLGNACQTESAQERMIGNWEAFQFLEEGDSVKIDPSEIKFSFGQNGRYHFSSTLNYKEAGTYKMAETVLYTTDTLTLSSIEKAVLIKKINQDTLVLEMKQENKNQVLSLKRIK